MAEQYRRLLLIKAIVAMATLSQTQVNRNYVLNFHGDAYNLDADMVDSHYFCVFLVYKIKAALETQLSNQ